MWIVYILIGVAILAIGATIGISFYKKSYFDNEKFASLKYDAGEIRAQYDVLTSVLTKYSESIYSNFAPPANKQMELQGYRTGAIEYNSSLSAHTYLCTSQHLANLQTYPMQSFRDFCGFVATTENLSILKEQARELFDFDNRLKSFKDSYAKQIKALDGQMPALIKMTARNEVIKRLRLDIDKDWEAKMCPQYTFKDMANKNQISLILTPTRLNELIAYLEKNPEQKKSTLNLRKEVPINATK